MIRTISITSNVRANFRSDEIDISVDQLNREEFPISFTNNNESIKIVLNKEQLSELFYQIDCKL